MMTNSLRQREPRRLGWVILSSLLTLSVLTTLNGCTRRFFRRRADAEVDTVLAQKDKYDQWKIADQYVYPHPLSRFADPTNPDRTPMPPDDPAAWDLSPHPQKPCNGIAYNEGVGYLDLLRKWDIENRTKKDAERAAEKENATDLGEEPLLPGETKTFAERDREVNEQIERELNLPTYGKAAPVTLESGAPSTCKPFILNLEQVTEIGFINSREFQTIREQLYLTALTVTAERFAFIAQPFATEQLVREKSGPRSPDGQTNRWLANTTTGFTKTFSTGALLLMNFANQTAYNLGGGRSGTTSVSTASVDFIQPFLAGGGRAVALEPLTQAERNLLYAIRDFYRFRQEYFVFFAAGQSTGFIPGVGAGVVAINPGTVQAPGAFVPGPFALPLVSNPATVQVPPTQPGGANLGSGVFVTPQGYLSAIQERANLVNYYKNIQALQRFLRLFDKFLEGGLINQVQKGQVEQGLLGNYETVLGQHVQYRISLDQLKQQLGLPMTVPIELDPGPIQPMITINEAYEKLSIDFERVVYNGLRYGAPSEAKQLRPRLRLLFERTPLMRGTKTGTRTLNRLPYWETLGKGQNTADRITALKNRLDELDKERTTLRDKQRTLPGEPLPEADQRRLEELYFDSDLGSYEYYLSKYELESWKSSPNTDPGARNRQANEEFRRVYQLLLAVVDKAFVERQQGIREKWPPLAPIIADGVNLLSASENEALSAAERTTMNNRLDLMNVRAQLVDSWRKIRVSANALLGTFNVDYHLDASSPAGRGNPFAIGGGGTRHELIFNAQLPLVRILQRNNYRSTLIAYQQNRRNLIGYEDQLLFNIRFDVRQLRVLANNYERVQKRQLELAYQQVDQALQAFNQPQAPAGGDLAGLVGPVGGRPQIGDPAALTQQLLSTQGSLLRAQTDLYSTWITYVIDRMDFYRDMGVMPLDNRGVWIDEYAAASNASNNNPGGQPQPAGGRPEQLPPPNPERGNQPAPQPSAQGPRFEGGK